MDCEIILKKNKNPILIKYNGVFGEEDADLLFSYLLCKIELDWKSYIISEGTIDKPVKTDKPKPESDSKSDSDSELDSKSNETIKKQENKEYETNYEIISFSDSVWYSRKYYGVSIEKYLIKKHRDVFTIIERKLSDVINDINDRDLANPIKFPTYWLCINYRDGFDHIMLSNLIRFYSSENPVILICLGESRELTIDTSVEESMDSGSVFVILPMKNKLEILENSCKKCHISLIGFYSGYQL